MSTEIDAIKDNSDREIAEGFIRRLLLPEASPEIRILKLWEVLRLTAMSRSTLYDRIARDGFPRQIHLGVDPKSRAVGWVESEVLRWLQDRIDSRG